MVETGMTPMHAIEAATVSASDLLGVSSQLGSIKPGKYADVIAVESDPLRNVHALEHVKFVMKQGIAYRQE